MEIEQKTQKFSEWADRVRPYNKEESKKAGIARAKEATKELLKLQGSLCGHQAPKGQWCDACANLLEHATYEKLPLKLQKHFIKQELDKLARLDASSITRENGPIDIKEFNKMQEVREVVKSIKSFGWNRVKLKEYFLLAGLILTFGSD